MYVVFPPVNTAIFELLIVLVACWSHIVSKASFCLITHSLTHLCMGRVL